MTENRRISVATLFDLLGEAASLLSLEAELLHECALVCPWDDLRDSIETVRGEVTWQEQNVRTALYRMGGDPRMETPSARAERPSVDALVDGVPPSSWDGGLRPVLYICELQKVIWAFLRSAIPYVGYQAMRDELEKLADDADEATAVRTDWLESTLQRLLLQRALREAEWDEAA